VILSILLGLWYVADRFLHYKIYDDRVVSLLTNSNGRMNKAVVIAAVQAKFPAGTSSSEILEFSELQGAFCSLSDGTHKCMIGVGAAFCLGTSIILEFPDGNLSRPVGAYVFEDGC
jgi:hypothetical protein